MPLTARGRSDAMAMATFLVDAEGLDPAAVDFVCSSLIQVRETAQIISGLIDVEFQEMTAVRNIFLGVLDGLSRQEAMRCYPEPARELEEWRAGARSIEDVFIPQAETMEDFYERIFGFVGQCSAQARDVVLVGTRSVGVAVANVVETRSSLLASDTYTRYLFDPGSVSKFVCRENESSIEYMNCTSFLAAPPSSPDS